MNTPPDDIKSQTARLIMRLIPSTVQVGGVRMNPCETEIHDRGKPKLTEPTSGLMIVFVDSSVAAKVSATVRTGIQAYFGKLILMVVFAFQVDETGAIWIWLLE
jgi:hypothetical protein